MPDPTPLDKKYTWAELCELIKKKITETEFIPKKQFLEHEFTNWFMSREGVGWRFDWKLVARAYIIWRTLKREHDHFTVIVGAEGSGKTTLAAQLCSWVSPEMDLNDIVFDMEQYIKKLRSVAKTYKKKRKDTEDKSILIDEGGISLFSRESLSRSNKVLAKTFMAQRFLNVHVCICIPHYWSLDKFIRQHRINTLIIVKQRGEYEAVVGKGINILNRLGMKDKNKNLWAIPIPYDYFWEGHFRRPFPKIVSVKRYENHKFRHIKNFIDAAELEASATVLVSTEKLEKELGIPKEDTRLAIQKGEIEGKRIGNKYFITQKAYKQLIRM